MTCKNVPPDERERLCGEIPLRRLAEPIEIAKLVRYLISEENTYLTGQTVVIDGGFLA
jgi:3-oxoacyl-[acyl-carrier protein] reductase